MHYIIINSVKQYLVSNLQCCIPACSHVFLGYGHQIFFIGPSAAPLLDLLFSSRPSLKTITSRVTKSSRESQNMAKNKKIFSWQPPAS